MNAPDTEWFRAQSAVPAPPGSTGSFFTPLPWFVAKERKLYAAGLIPAPFDCDPFAHPEAPVSKFIARRGGLVLTREDDGIKTPWAKVGEPARVAFVNPEYNAEALALALERVERASQRREVLAAVALVPAWPDRAWWQDFIEPGRRAGRLWVEFERGRLRFGWPGNPEADNGDGAKFPSAVVVWRGQQ